MTVAKDKVITLNFTLTDDDNNVLDRAENGQFTYLHGAQNFLPDIESALEGKSAGDTVKIRITPEQAYGHRDEEKTQVVPIEMFESAEQVTVGQQFHAQGEHGETILITVTNIENNQVTIDGNHPFAGLNLNFDIEVVDIRDASSEELAHGHVHGPGGHQH